MDHLASTLIAFPRDDVTYTCEAFDKAAKQHVSRLAKLLKEQTAALTPAKGAQLLDLTNPQVNTISYAVLLDHVLQQAMTAKGTREGEALLPRIMQLLVAFDARQARFVGTPLANILRHVLEDNLFPAAIAVELAARAILKIDPTGSMMTYAHYLLVRLAYNSDNVELALPVLDKDILYYPTQNPQQLSFVGSSDTARPEGEGGAQPPTAAATTTYLSDMSLPPQCYIAHSTGLSGGAGSNGLRSAVVLEYDLLRALCYISRRDWHAARRALERVVSYPSRDGGVSRIQVEAYKKWVLVSLLCFGRVRGGGERVGSAGTGAPATARVARAGTGGVNAAGGLSGAGSSNVGAVEGSLTGGASATAAGGGITGGGSGGGGAGGGGALGNGAVAVPPNTGPQAAKVYGGAMCKPYVMLAAVFESGSGGVADPVATEAAEAEMAGALARMEQNQPAGEAGREGASQPGESSTSPTARASGEGSSMDVTTTASEETGAGTGPQTSGRGGNGGGGGGDSASSKARVPLRATNLTPAMQLVEDARLGAATWAEDGNTGLVAAVQRYYVRWQIASLRSVYSKASLSQVRRLTRSGETGLPLQSDEELVAVVQEMIDEGMLRGKVVMPGEGESESANRPPPHIVFFPSEDDATLRDEKLMARELRRVAERVSETERHVRAARERLTATKEFARYVLSGGRIPGGLGGDGGGGDGKDGGGGPPSLSRAGSSSLVWGVGRGGASGILGGDITAGTSGDIFRRFGFSPQFGVAGSNLSSIFAGESSLMYEESDLGAEDEDLMAGLTSD